MKVFVASTCFDLIDARSELASDLRDMGLEPVLSDDNFSEFDYAEAAQGRHSIETCIQNLKSCKCAIFLVSQRYGSKLGAYGIPDISATHHEYRTAQAENIPILFYVRDKTLAEYNMWRQNVAFGNARRFCTSDDVFTLIQEHDKRVGRPHDSTNWIASFTSTVDLKKAIRKQLDRESMKEELARLMRGATEIPTFVLTMKSSQRSKSIEDFRREVYNGIDLKGAFMIFRLDIMGTTILPHSVTAECDRFQVWFHQDTAMHSELQPVALTDYRGIVIVDRNKMIKEGMNIIKLEIEFTAANGFVLKDHYDIVIMQDTPNNLIQFSPQYRGKELISRGMIYDPAIEPTYS